MTEPVETDVEPARRATFLRRFAQHLKRQDWFAVGIELLIVVLGVYLGLQVNTWAAAQADKRRGEVYVERLIADMESDLRNRRGMAAYYGDVYDSAERAYALLEEPDADARELVISAYRATEYNYAPPTTATWDEIVSSGDLALLPRAAIENGASAYFADDTARTSSEPLRDSYYRRRVRGLIPHDVQRAIRAGCSDVRDAQGQTTGFSQNCQLDLPPDRFEAAARALRSDPGVMTDLRYHFSGVWNARINLEADVIFLEGALMALRESQVGRR